MSSFYIAAAHKSSGKTTLSIGLSGAIRQRGLTIQTFKKGPDYIDPIWLRQASGSDCFNLDFYTSSREYITQQFDQYRQGKDVVLVEGNMGLFDGMSVDGRDSNAAMAKLLGLPVVLVIDCTGTSRGIAPLLKGYQDFDRELNYAGVILNKTAGRRHESKLTEMVQTYTDFDILGCVPRNANIQLTERHLGLIPGNEMAEQSNEVIDQLAQQANEFIDIDRLLRIQSKPIVINAPLHKVPETSPDAGLTIGVAMDKAFGFYYPGDLQRFAQLGVKLVPFSTLVDNRLPENIDGLFIGGGFPETQMEKLSANKSLLNSIRQSITLGLPTYAECGGLMYLCQDLTYLGDTYNQCNVIPAQVVMNKRPQGRGYTMLETQKNHPWYQHDQTTRVIKAHEFHYSSMVNVSADLDYAYSIKRGTGIDGINDGIIMHNLLANYAHMRTTDQCSWVDDFVLFVKKCKRSL